MRLEGRSAIVTGGGSGIGRGIVLCMAREGADIAIADVSVENANKVVEEVKALGRKAIVTKTDVTKAPSVEEMASAAIAAFGKVDILVNNAGIISVGGRLGMPFTNNTEEDWDIIYDIDLKALFLTCKALAPHMMGRRSGKIINISSIAGKNGSQTNPPYSVAKAGVINFTRALALDLAPYNINVNAICPGFLWTPLWETITKVLQERNPAYKGMTGRQVFEQRVKALVPLGREQTPEDIGHMAAFLASDEAKNITGQAINVDGGTVMY
jgi:NAD(P)-dependent dehydrogenase (short-subunit alcohol dehydrogenase family)